ncbi:MAG: CRTAC1 family protein [Acidobacteriota bacterium]
MTKLSAAAAGILFALASVLLATAAVWAQASGPEPTADRLVELVAASSEREAKVVARAMRDGFLVEMLLVPGTQYVGRRSLGELPSAVREVIAKGPAGEPQLLAGGGGQFLVGRILESSLPAHLGSESYAQDAKTIWSVLSVGPTDPKLLSLETDVDVSSLPAVCRSKADLARSGVESARGAVASLSPQASPPELLSTYADLISSLSFQGDMVPAIEAVRNLMARLPERAPDGSTDHRDTMHRVLGILELRRGEVENCLRHHHREMCVFPLSENARHVADDGAQKALGHFLSFLESQPDDLEVRWLLNIAAMTLGRHPDGVPERWRLAPELFQSEEDVGRFVDISMPAGLARSDNAGGSVADDFDGDGFMDLVVSSRDPCSPLRFYRSRGDGTFADETERAGLLGQLGGLNVTQVDFDRDGALDLYVMRGGWETAVRDSLLRQRRTPDGLVFEDVTAAAGLGGSPQRTHSAAWADYDGDGRIDVFLGHELSWSRLMRNRGDGTFEDITDRAGVRLRSLTKGAVWGDVDGDRRPDLFVSNFGERNLLFRNRGDGTFEEIGRAAGVSDPIYSFGAAFWDYDNDGRQDLFVTSYLQTVDEVAREFLGLAPRGETLRVFRGRGDGTFEDRTAAVDLALVIPAMGMNVGDIDNDGFLDLYLGTGAPSYGLLIPNRLFVNRPASGGGRRFVDVTTSSGTGHLQKGHGVSFLDVDHDGDLDLFANLGGAFPGDKYPSVLFENPGRGHDWIAVELADEGHRSVRGSRIRVVMENTDGAGERFRWLSTGGSFGASPRRQHIGLGRDARIVRLEVDWPASIDEEAVRRSVFEDVPINRVLRVTRGRSAPEQVPLPPQAPAPERRSHDEHGP